MITLETRLQKVIAKRGDNSPLAQMIRNQIAAEKGGQSLQNLYVTGAVKRPRQK